MIMQRNESFYVISYAGAQGQGAWPVCVAGISNNPSVRSEQISDHGGFFVVSKGF